MVTASRVGILLWGVVIGCGGLASCEPTLRQMALREVRGDDNACASFGTTGDLKPSQRSWRCHVVACKLGSAASCVSVVRGGGDQPWPKRELAARGCALGSGESCYLHAVLIGGLSLCRMPPPGCARCLVSTFALFET